MIKKRITDGVYDDVIRSRQTCIITWPFLCPLHCCSPTRAHHLSISEAKIHDQARGRGAQGCATRR
jgi:hypothetical protein